MSVRSWDMRRRIAQERVPTTGDAGSRGSASGVLAPLSGRIFGGAGTQRLQTPSALT